MKRVLIFLGTVFGLFIIAVICLEFFGLYDISFTITPNKPTWLILTVLFGISLGGPLIGLLMMSLVRIISNAFKPKFVRIANNLEHSVKKNRNIGHRLNIPQKRDLLAEKMQHIWKKADMQYPLSELDFDKLKGAKPSV